MKMQSVMTPNQLFTKVASPEIQRSTFDRSHGYKTTLDSGKLIPVFVEEALPGDTFQVKAALFGRMATPLKPIMDNIFLDIHFFSCPIRLVWENWKKFNGEQRNPSDSTDFLMPTITAPAGGFTEGSIYDYLGVPTKVDNITIRADILRCVNLIYNEWYRDENLQDSLVDNYGDGPDLHSDYTILPRGKRKDYFTSALPWPQKGEQVSVPIGTSAPITTVSGLNNAGLFKKASDDSNFIPAGSTSIDAYIGDGTMRDATAATELYYNPNGTLQADLSSATAATINQLREAFQIQKVFERDARGGTRYTEMIYAHFGITTPDARLQRPEFLGGGSTPVNVSPVQQTSSSDGTSPQGNLAAIGTVLSTGNGFTKSFTEHEIVLGFVSIRADLNYQQGLNRMWSRSTRFDHYLPAFAHLGEQAILNKEIYAQGTAADDEVFGYQERFAEYRYKPSMVTGLFRSNATTSLDVWHLSQDFSSLPALNASFIEENPPIDRVIAVPSEPQFILDCFFDFKATRPMPTFSVPGLIDHF